MSLIDTTIRLQCYGGLEAAFSGRFGALTEIGALEMSVLGRDILDLFTLILDREHNVVMLINQRHHYIVVDD